MFLINGLKLVFICIHLYIHTYMYRFTGDLYQVDKELRRALEMVLVKGLKLVFVIAVVLYVTPSFVIVAALMAVVYFYVQVHVCIIHACTLSWIFGNDTCMHTCLVIHACTLVFVISVLLCWRLQNN
jgi:hypothetical protein